LVSAWLSCVAVKRLVSAPMDGNESNTESLEVGVVY
jgi:hypothetical protein